MATFKVYRNREGTRRYGVLSGGATGDYEISGDIARYYSTYAGVCTDGRPWATVESEHEGTVVVERVCKSFQRVIIASDVTGIGNNFFAFFENADFVFVNPAGIEHLGQYAFYLSGISGSVALPGLSEAVPSAAFLGCTKLSEIDLSGSTATAIRSSAFANCYNLHTVKGCANIQTIGAGAFIRCAALENIDLSRETVTRIGHSAFHITGIGTLLDDYDDAVFKSSDGKTAAASIRKRKFDAGTLAAIQSVELPDVGSIPKTTNEQNYPDLPYGMKGTMQDYLSSGCMMLSLYHAFQCVYPDAGIADFPAFWAEVNELYSDEYGLPVHEQQRSWNFFYRIAGVMGLQCKDYAGNELANTDDTHALLTDNAYAKAEIARALAAGYGIVAGISPGSPEILTEDKTYYGKKFLEGDAVFQNGHEVAIVGCRDGKLLVVDSAYIDGDKGGVYAVAYEDLFIGMSGWNDIRVLMPKEVSA